MTAQDLGLGIEVRDGARDASDSIERSDTESQLLDGSNQMAKIRGGQPRDVLIRSASEGESPRPRHPATDRLEVPNSTCILEKPIEGRWLHLDLEIETVQHGPSDAIKAVPTLPPRSVPSPIGIHRGHHQRLRRHPDRARRSCDGDDPLFEGLPQRIDRRSGELRKLVEQKNPAVRETDLAGTGNGPPPTIATALLV